MPMLQHGFSASTIFGLAASVAADEELKGVANVARSLGGPRVKTAAAPAVEPVASSGWDSLSAYEQRNWTNQARRFRMEPREFYEEKIAPNLEIARAPGSLKAGLLGGIGQIGGVMAAPVEKLVLEPGAALAATADSLLRVPAEELVEFAGGPQRTTQIVSPLEALENAKEYGPGRSLAIQAGLPPDSLEAKIIGFAADFIASWYADPLVVLGKISKGVRQAERIPKGGPNDLRGIARTFYDLNAQTPEELVTTPLAQQGIDAIWSEVSKGKNANAIVDRFRLPTKMADEMSGAASRDEIETIVLDGLHGRTLKGTREQMRASLDDIEERLTDELLEGRMDSPTYTSLAKERDYLKSALEVGRDHRVFIRQVPEDTAIGALRQSLKRGRVFSEPVNDATEAIAGAAPQVATLKNRTPLEYAMDMAGSKWLRTKTRMLPNRGVSILDRDAGRVQFQRVGEALQLPQQQVDEFVNRYISAGGRSEVIEAYTDMLKAGRHSLPPGYASALTQFASAPSNSMYWVDGAGRSVSKWARKVMRGNTEIEYAQPHLWSEHADELPLPDIRGIEEAARLSGRIRHSMLDASKKLGEKGKLGAVAGAGVRIVPETWRAADHMVSLLTSVVWKPAVLLRLGWPIKVVGEEQVRMAANDIPSMWNNPLEWLANIRSARHMDIPEEALADRARELIEVRRSANGLLSHGEKGYGEAVQSEMLRLRSDPVVRYRLSHTPEETASWLETGGGAQYARDMTQTWETVGVRNASEYVATIDERLGQLAPMDELRAAMRDGKLDVGGAQIQIDSSQFVEHLASLPVESLPARVRDNAEFWRMKDQGKWRRATGAVYEYLGSKPTNWLSRRPAWAHHYTGEKARLTGLLGESPKTKELIEQKARDYATKATRDLLFDLGERSAFTELHKNAAPFFNAWQEVMERWLVTIPGDITPGLGQAVIARRVQLLADALGDSGVAERDEDGKLQLNVAGWQVPVGRLMPLGGMFPFTGPVLGVAVSPISKRVQRSTDAFNAFFDLVQPYGPETTLGPAYLNNGWRWATGKAPPWEFMTRDYQETLWEGARIDAMRSIDAETGAMRTIAAIEDPAERKEATARFLAQVTSKARGHFGARAARGWLLPVQPRRYWKDAKEADAFRAKLFAMQDGEDKGGAVSDFLAANPRLATFLIPKSYRVKGEQPRETSRASYWKDWREKNVSRYTADEWATIGIGSLAYDSFREQENTALEKIATNAQGRLANMFEVMELASVRRNQVENLKRENPSWAHAFANGIENARRRDGKPTPDIEEIRLQEIMTGLSTLSSIIDGDGEDIVDFGLARQLRRQIKDFLRPERFYSDTELPAGVERDMAWYFREVFDPYMARVEEFFAAAEGKTSIERAELFEGLRRFRNEQKPMKGGPGEPLRVYVAESGYRENVLGAIDAWNKASGSDLVVAVSKPGPGVVTVRSIPVEEGKAPEAEYLADRSEIVAAAGVSDVVTFTHEIGHALGLPHPEIDPTTSTGEGLMGRGSDVPTAVEVAEALRRRGTQNYPTPESVLFSMKAPEEQAATRRKWALSPVEWMTDFQRETMGIDADEKTRAFWDAVNDSKLTLRNLRIKNRWTPSQREYRQAQEAQKAYEEKLAIDQGLTGELALSRAKPYERLRYFRQVPAGDAWEATFAAADAVWQQLNASDVGPASKLGEYWRRNMFEWIGTVRAARPAFAAEIDALQEQTRFRKRGTDSFMDHLFFDLGA